MHDMQEPSAGPEQPDVRFGVHANNRSAEPRRLFVTTKREALQLAEQLVPEADDMLRVARERWKAYETDTTQFLLAADLLKDRWVDFLGRLMERDTRIYKRARVWLFATMVKRQHEVLSKLTAEWHLKIDAEYRQRNYNKYLAAQEMRGCGDGI
jgi:hypothetical protein